MQRDPLLAQLGLDVLGDLRVEGIGDDPVRQLDEAHLLALMDQGLDHLQPDKAGADHHRLLVARILHRRLERQSIAHAAQAEHPLLLQAGDGGHLFAGTCGYHQPIVAIGEAVALVLHPQGLGRRVQAQHPVANLHLYPLGGELLRGELGHVARLLEIVPHEVGQTAGPEGDHL
ncbi:hypothetical protein D3C85_1282930 [compost metagenome]